MQNLLPRHLRREAVARACSMMNENRPEGTPRVSMQEAWGRRGTQLTGAPRERTSPKWRKRVLQSLRGAAQ